MIRHLLMKGGLELIGLGKLFSTNNKRIHNPKGRGASPASPPLLCRPPAATLSSNKMAALEPHSPPMLGGRGESDPALVLPGAWGSEQCSPTFSLTL